MGGESYAREGDYMRREKELMLEIQVILEQQQLLLRQKSRAHWLVDAIEIQYFLIEYFVLPGRRLRLVPC